jgi:hypothetical protein
MLASDSLKCRFISNLCGSTSSAPTGGHGAKGSHVVIHPTTLGCRRTAGVGVHDTACLPLNCQLVLGHTRVPPLALAVVKVTYDLVVAVQEDTTSALHAVHCTVLLPEVEIEDVNGEEYMAHGMLITAYGTHKCCRLLSYDVDYHCCASQMSSDYANERPIRYKPLATPVVGGVCDKGMKNDNCQIAPRK